MKKELTTDEIFEIKQKFLRDIPHPTLIKKQILKLNKQLFNEDKYSGYKQSNKLLNHLKSHTASLLPLKLSIANCQSQNDLASLLSKLLDLQKQLVFQLSSYVLIPIENMHDSIKMSTAFDVHSITKFIEQNGLIESEIKNYICTELEQKKIDNYSILTAAVIRANKIVNHE